MSNSTIPSADDVNVSSRRPNYRFANGQLCTGRAEEIQSVPKLVGELRRVGIYNGRTNEGEEYQFLEIDLDTSDGLIHVHTSTSSKTATLGFALGLMEIAKDELMALSAGQSKEKNRFGRFTTYANVYRVDPKTLQSTSVGRNQRKDEDFNDLFADALEAITSHPAYAERVSEYARSSDSSESAGLTDEIIAKGVWADPSVHKAAYMKLAASVYTMLHEEAPDREYSEWSQVPQDVLNALREKHGKGVVPKALKGLAPAPKPSADDEYDPFADE